LNIKGASVSMLKFVLYIHFFADVITYNYAINLNVFEAIVRSAPWLSSKVKA